MPKEIIQKVVMEWREGKEDVQEKRGQKEYKQP